MVYTWSLKEAPFVAPLCRKPQTHPIHHADKIQHGVEKEGRWSTQKNFPIEAAFPAHFFNCGDLNQTCTIYYVLLCFDGENKERRILCRLWPKGGGHKSWITAKSFFPLILRCRVVEFPKIVIFKKKKMYFCPFENTLKNYFWPLKFFFDSWQFSKCIK